MKLGRHQTMSDKMAVAERYRPSGNSKGAPKVKTSVKPILKKNTVGARVKVTW